MIYNNLSLFYSYKILHKVLKQQLSTGKIFLRRPPKLHIPMGITIIGANSNVGRMSAMLFKRENIFKNLVLYDDKCTCCLGCDLCNINTAAHISYYSERKNLELAVTDIPIIYICGGIQTVPGTSEKDLFDKNVAWVRQAITYCAEFNPQANVVITTPPINYLVPLAIEEFRKNDINAEKRVFGVTTNIVSRANSVTGCKDCFIVGGCHRNTVIPITSHTKDGQKLDNDESTQRIQDVEESALRQKIRESNGTGCFLSTAYNGVKFTTSLARALQGAANVQESAFVKQTPPMEDYAKYFSCLVQLDKHGVKSCHIPKMSQTEKHRLKKVINEIRLGIYLGSSYVTGDEMIVVRIPPKEKEKALKIEPLAKKEKPPVPCEKTRPPKRLTIVVEDKIPGKCCPDILAQKLQKAKK